MSSSFGQGRHNCLIATQPPKHSRTEHFWRSKQAADNIVNTLDLKGVIEADFSPLGTYIATWNRWVKPADEKEQCRNLSIYRVSDGQLITRFTQKTQNSWKPQWAPNESFFARLSSDSDVLFYNPTGQANVSGTLPSAGKIPGDKLTVFSKEKNGVPGNIKLYDLEKALTESGAVCVATRSLFNADSVDFLWNADGTAILVHTHTDVDKSNQSYYGKSTLQLMTTTAPHYATQILDLANPIHSISWSPNSKEYIVLHGPMPSKCTLFTVASGHPTTPSQAIYEFPPAARNTVYYSPHGRLILTAGFGNLAGDFSIWDRADFKELCTVRAANASSAQWSPDGRHILTSTLYKRLKVDNGVRVFHHSGVLVATMDVKELYGSAWRFDDCGKWPMKRGLSAKPEGIQDAEAIKKATVQPTAGKYVPPALRGKVGATTTINKTREEQLKPQGPIGVIAGAYVAPRAVSTPVGAAPVQSNEENCACFIPVDADLKAMEIEKKVKAVQKKLKAIADIKKKKADGVQLELTQIQKMEGEAALLKELADLNLQLGN
ncbi:eIF2A-domain-containing protein [Rhizoclosmatium globosum]|uniref:Eukaryotic translation initiation factor 2A n=1 Tax=Rhizoclosmatium globosum TaxID=329046 RepID=A0A1Y2CCY9_9FUNG|nr:eIF2A-domain-containing protein [Rhizoclosmatium globosum]|eukprot:ORY44684.1 eIF2A-domain-containing protein [Rhizoclosmatium globosum]